MARITLENTFLFKSHNWTNELFESFKSSANRTTVYGGSVEEESRLFHS